MLYVFHGTDMAQASDKARHLVDSLRTKKPDASFVKLEGDSWDASVVEGHLGGQGLFSSKYIVYLDRVTENADAKERLSEFAAAMQESPNIFIVLEGKLNAELKRAFEKSADKMVDCEKKTAASPGGAAGSAGTPDAGGFNIFALAGAVASRDAFKAWRIYREAIDGGSPLEPLLGMLFWKAKSIDNKELARDILVLYHDGHRGLVDLELATERLVLNCGKR